MTRLFKVLAAGMLVTSLSGCAAEIGTAIGMQIQKASARGENIDKYRDAFGRSAEVETALDGQPAYTWDLSYYEDVTVEGDSYAYYNTDRPGMTTGITYERRTLLRKCLLTMSYDPQTRLVTDVDLPNAVKCRKVRSALKKI